MPGTATCTVLADQGGIRVDIDWTGDAHPDAPLKVERSVDGGPFEAIRGAYAPMQTALSGTGPAVYNTTNCGLLIMWDFEMPFDVPVVYRVTDDPNGDTVTTTACTVPSGGKPWLKDPLRPCHNLPLVADCEALSACPLVPSGVIWTGHDQEVYASDSAQFAVVGLRRPVDVSNVRRDAYTVLQFVSVTCADRDALLELTEPGTPVFMPAMAEFCWPARYLALGEHRVSPLVRDLRRQQRLHTLPAVVVDAPVGPMCCTEGTTWCDMCNQAETWDDFDALALSGIDVLHGLAS